MIQQDFLELTQISNGIGLAILCRDMLLRTREEFLEEAKRNGSASVIQTLHEVQREFIRAKEASPRFRREMKILEFHSARCSAAFASIISAIRREESMD